MLKNWWWEHMFLKYWFFTALEDRYVDAGGESRAKEWSWLLFCYWKLDPYFPLQFFHVLYPHWLKQRANRETLTLRLTLSGLKS